MTRRFPLILSTLFLAMCLWLYFGCLTLHGRYTFSGGREGWQAIRGRAGDRTLAWKAEGGDGGGHLVSTGPWWIDPNHAPEIFVTREGKIGKVESADTFSTGDLHLVCFTGADELFPSPWLRLRTYAIQRLDDTVIPLVSRTVQRWLSSARTTPSDAVSRETLRTHSGGTLKMLASRLLYNLPAPRLDLRGAVIRGSIRGAGVDLKGASLVFWFQGYDRDTKRFVNFALEGRPLNRLLASGRWEPFEIKLTPDAPGWKCLGSSTFNQRIYGNAPVERVLGDANRNFGFILFPLKDRRPDGSLDPMNVPSGRIEFDSIEVQARPKFEEPIILVASAAVACLSPRVLYRRILRRKPAPGYEPVPARRRRRVKRTHRLPILARIAGPQSP